MIRVKPLLPAIFASIAIIVGSGISGSKVSLLLPFDMLMKDKLLHFSAYLVLTILWGVGLDKLQSNRAIHKALLITICLGVIMEVCQYAFFVGRQFEILDIIANISGSLVGVMIFKRFIK